MALSLAQIRYPALGLGLRVQGLGFGLGFSVKKFFFLIFCAESDRKTNEKLCYLLLGFRVQGSGFRVYGLWFRVRTFPRRAH
jgi:hypothetical protein